MPGATDVLYFAPGSGLGHLNRALALCLELRRLGVRAGIVTNSPFAEGFAAAARFPVTRIPAAHWRLSAPRLLEERSPRLAVVDTFPLGLRGEWTAGLPVPAVYVARRLKLDAYAAAAGPSHAWGRYARVIAAETLSAPHEAAIAATGSPLLRLPGFIRLRPGELPTPVPSDLARILDSGNAWLIVHGGPEEEVLQLVEEARRAMPAGAELAVLSPWPDIRDAIERRKWRSFDYYPAGNLVARAARVVSGAGYNMMADMMPLAGRHTPLAFERRFDDQAGRLASLPPSQADGAAEAAAAIVDALRG